MDIDMFDNDDLAPDEGAEKVSESVTDEGAATPSRPVVKSSTRRRRPVRREATGIKATKKAAGVEKVSSSKTVAIQSIYPGTVIANVPGGNSYRWEKPGAVVQVAKSDVDSVMKKNGDGARECCGSSSTPVYFVLVD